VSLFPVTVVAIYGYIYDVKNVPAFWHGDVRKAARPLQAFHRRDEYRRDRQGYAGARRETLALALGEAASAEAAVSASK